MAISLGDNIAITGPKPNDSRYLNNLTPWSSVSAVNAALTGGVGGVRYTGLTVNILGQEYWYKDGIADGDLVVKSNNELFADTQDPTGFLNNDNIQVKYNVDRTITLSATTGTIEYYFNGVKHDLGTTWSSSAHTNTTDTWFLYSTDGVNIEWSTTPWTFNALMVAARPLNTNYAIREIHGTMPWQAHVEFHQTIGTYRVSGFGFTSGTYALQPAVPSNTGNTIGFEAGVIKDEDINTSLAAWIKGTYTHLHFTGASSHFFQTGETTVFNTGATYPKIFPYDGTGFTETEMITGEYANWYVLRIPVTSDVVSQRYRAVIVQPQFKYSTLEAAQAENPISLYFGDITTISPEFVLVERITMHTDSGYTSADGRVRIEALTVLSGTRLSQVNTVAGLGTVTAGNVSVVPQSPFTSTNLQGLSDAYAGRFATTITGATNLGTGNGTIYTSVSNKNIQLKSLSAGTNITLTPNGSYVTISSTGGGGGSTASGERITKLVCQIGHGFNDKDVVGWSGGTYNKPIADGTYDGEILGLVSSCLNSDCFNLTQAGYVTGLTSLSQNDTYFLSDSTAGLLTTTKPVTVGHIVKSVLIADSTTSGWVLPYAGYQLSVSSGSTSLSEFTITGNSSTTGFTINHGSGNQFVIAQIVKNSSPYPTVYTNVERTNANCIYVTFDTPPANGQEYKILIIN